MLDCSPRGLCLLAPTRMKLREQFLLKLRFERLMLVLYTVRHCAEGDYADWRHRRRIQRHRRGSPIHAEVVFETLLSLPDGSIPSRFRGSERKLRSKQSGHLESEPVKGAYTSCL